MAIKQSFPNVQIIAEDLGFLTQEVKELLSYSGFPGMKIIQFAFDSREKVTIFLLSIQETVWFIQERMTMRQHLDG